MVLRDLRVLALATLITTKCAGLYTNPNDVGEVPDGALAQADNVVITRDGIIEPKRDFSTVGSLSGLAPDAVTSLTSFGSRYVAAGKNGSVYPVMSSTDTVNWTTAASLQGPVTRYAQANSNLYTTSSDGVRRWESLSPATVYLAGLPPGTDVGATVSTDAGTSLGAGKSAAYRAIWTYTDANGNKIVGAPSSRAIVTNSGGSTVDVYVSFSIPSFMPASTVAEFYRTVTVTGTPDDEMALVGTRTVPTNKTVTDLARGATYVTATTSVAHGFNAGDVISLGHGTAGAGAFTLGTLQIYDVPSTTTFRYVQGAGVATANGLSITARPLAVGIRDNVVDSIRGQALYTNPTQGTILAGRYEPPACTDMAVFRGCMFYANTTELYQSTVTLLSVGAPNGLQLNDTITINTIAYTASTTEIPDDQTNTFILSTGGTASENVANTALSLVRAINRHGGSNSGTLASYISGPNDNPGIIRIWLRSHPGGAFSTSASRSTAWLGLGAATAETRINGLTWSEQDAPDGVPLVNYTRVGSALKPILRIVPLRDSMIIIKEDGIYRLTGDGPSTFRVDPLDLTIVCVAPETAVALENTVFCLTRFGVVRISDTGVSVISRPIENQIKALCLVPSFLSTTYIYAFGLGYESDHKYHLFLNAGSGVTYANQSFVYDIFTQTWTFSNRAARCGHVSPIDDKMYLAFSGSVLQERKVLASDDYVAEAHAITINSTSGKTATLASAVGVDIGDRIVRGVSAVVTAVNGNVVTFDRTVAFSTGPGSCYNAYALAVTWSPNFGGDPSSIMHAREVDLLFRSVYFANATVTFSTDLYPSGIAVPIDGVAAGLVDPPTGPRSIRVWIPRECQRGTRLSIKFAMTQAQCEMQLQGIKVIYEPGSERSNR